MLCVHNIVTYCHLFIYTQQLKESLIKNRHKYIIQVNKQLYINIQKHMNINTNNAYTYCVYLFA